MRIIYDMRSNKKTAAKRERELFIFVQQTVFFFSSFSICRKRQKKHFQQWDLPTRYVFKYSLLVFFVIFHIHFFLSFSLFFNIVILSFWISFRANIYVAGPKHLNTESIYNTHTNSTSTLFHLPAFQTLFSFLALYARARVFSFCCLVKTPPECTVFSQYYLRFRTILYIGVVLHRLFSIQSGFFVASRFEVELLMKNTKSDKRHLR